MLRPPTSSKRIPRWVYPKASIFSISSSCSCGSDPENDQRLPQTFADFEAKIPTLKNKLSPESLIKALHSTTDLNSALRIFKWASLQERFNHTVHTYYWMILKLGLIGNVTEMDGLCQNMVRDGCPGVEKALVALIDAFVRQLRLDEAIRILVIMSSGGYKPCVDVFNLVLGALVEEKRGFRDVVFVYKEMVKAGVVPSLDTLNYLLEILFETDRVDSALDQYRRLNKKGCDPNSKTFEIVIKGLIAKDRVDDSLVILNEILETGCTPELSFYACIIPLFCGENKLEPGIRLFRMMKNSNFLPDAVIYGALIQCLCSNFQWDDAMTLLEEMMENHLTPSSDVLVDVVSGLCKLGKINEAMNFLEDKHILETSPYNTLLSCCCNAGRFFEAKGLLKKMSEMGIADSDSWNILVGWLCAKVELKQAHELLSRMIVSSVVPDSATYSALVVGNCRLCKYEDALQLFFWVRVKCWVLDLFSYSELVEGLCMSKKYLKAINVFRYMSENGCPLHFCSFYMLVKGICESGLVKEAINLRFLADSSGTYIDGRTYNYLLLALSKLAKGENLLAFLSQMLVKGCNLDAHAYCILIQSMMALGQIKASVLFFNKMVDEGLLPDPDTLHSLLLCLTNWSMLSSISSAIDQLSDYEVLDSTLYNMLVIGHWKEGNRDKARQLLDQMLEKGWVPETTTHRLLIDSIDARKAGDERIAYERFTIHDDVGDILADGLGTM